MNDPLERAVRNALADIMSTAPQNEYQPTQAAGVTRTGRWPYVVVFAGAIGAAAFALTYRRDQVATPAEAPPLAVESSTSVPSLARPVVDALTESFLSRYGVEDVGELEVVAAPANAVALAIDQPLSVDAEVTIVFAIGEFTDRFATTPVGGRPVVGRTAYALVLPDGSILGGGLHPADLTGRFAELGDPVPLIVGATPVP